MKITSSIIKLTSVRVVAWSSLSTRGKAVQEWRGSCRHPRTYRILIKCRHMFVCWLAGNLSFFFLIPTAALPIPTLPCCSSLCREGEDPAGPRAATLTVARGAGRTAAKAVDTPACMLFTRSGHPPSLLPDLLQQVPDLTVAMVSYRSLWLTPGPKVLADFGKGVGAFVNMPADTVVVCGASDPENMPPDGCVPHARVLHRQQQPRSGLPMLPRFSVISISFPFPLSPPALPQPSQYTLSRGFSSSDPCSSFVCGWTVPFLPPSLVLRCAVCVCVSCRYNGADEISVFTPAGRAKINIAGTVLSLTTRRGHPSQPLDSTEG